jgi:hypothetical protein
VHVRTRERPKTHHAHSDQWHRRWFCDASANIARCNGRESRRRARHLAPSITSPGEWSEIQLGMSTERHSPLSCTGSGHARGRGRGFIHRDACRPLLYSSDRIIFRRVSKGRWRWSGNGGSCIRR